MSTAAQYAEARVVQNTKCEMENYTAEMFMPYVGQVIEFDRPADVQGGSGNRVQLELLEVRRPDAGTRPEGFRAPFALLFALRGPDPPGRGLHRIAHHDFEPSDWFIARVSVPGGNPSVAYYEAVFG